MISFFTIPEQDKSMLFLGKIFGSVAHLFDGFTFQHGTQQATMTVFANMFKIFNLTVLTVGALIIVYTTIMGVMQTAHEGEFLGKKWHKLWTPLRMVFGIATLVPTSSGYSAIQVIIMWVVIQGIGAADTLWEGVLKYKQVMGSLYSQPVVNTTTVRVQVENLFKDLVCLATKRADFFDPADRFSINSAFASMPAAQKDKIQKTMSDYYYCQNSYNAGNVWFCKYAQTMNKLTGADYILQQMQPRPGYAQGVVPFGAKEENSKEGICGQMKVDAVPAQNCDELPFLADRTNCLLKQKTREAQQQVLANKIIPYLGLIAGNIAKTDYAYMMYYYYLESVIPNITGVTDTPYPASNVQQPTLLKDWKFGDDLRAWIRNAESRPYGYLQGTTVKDFSNLPEPVGKKIWEYILSPSLKGENFIDQAVNFYTDALTKVILEVINDARSLENKESDQTSRVNIAKMTVAHLGGKENPQYDLETAKLHGWIYAGAYYYLLAQSNDGMVASSNPQFSVELPPEVKNPQGIAARSERSNNQLADQILKAMSDDQQGKMGAGGKYAGVFAGSSLPAPLDKINAQVYNTAGSIMESFAQNLTGSTSMLGESKGIQFSVNPLSNLQMTGRVIVGFVEGFFIIYTIIAFVAAILGNISPFVLGTGIMNPVGPTFSTLSLLLTPLIVAFMSSFFVFGATLAVYVPLVPYLVFTLSALGWMMGVIESMVASPLVALGILSPGGDHEILGKSGAAIGLLFGLFLRPSLMLFGLMAGMLLSGVGVTMVNLGFQMAQALLTSVPSLLEMIVFLATYVFLIITVVNKSFSLIHLIPERTLSWLGMHAQSFGEEQGLGEVKQGMQGAAAGAGAMAGAGAAGQYGGFEAGKKAAETRGEAEADRQAISEAMGESGGKVTGSGSQMADAAKAKRGGGSKGNSGLDQK